VAIAADITLFPLFAGTALCLAKRDGAVPFTPAKTVASVAFVSAVSVRSTHSAPLNSCWMFHERNLSMFRVMEEVFQVDLIVTLAKSGVFILHREYT